MNRYPVKYSDSRDSETSVITNDDEELRIWLRRLELTEWLVQIPTKSLVGQ